MLHHITVLLVILIALSLIPATLASAEETGAYPAKRLMTRAQADTVRSLAAVNEAHTFYTLDYTADYQLDELLAADVTNMEEMTAWIAANLLRGDGAPKTEAGGGCSAFAALNEAGQPVYGRNYDYVQNAQNILVHCRPQGGYESYSIAAGGWIYDGQLDDGQTDLSLLVAAPYFLMDGMNEKGLIVSVLKLDGEGTAQRAAGKHSVVTTLAMRMILDKAASVEEALNLLSAYNMHSAMPVANFHFYLADAAGHYCALEYAPGDRGVRAAGSFDVGRIADAAFRAQCDGSDGDGQYRMLTNFYALFPAETYGFDDGKHGLDRYEILREKLAAAGYRLDEAGAMSLLKEVYQDYGATSTHETQWSVVYNPVALTIDVCPRVNQSDGREAFYQAQYRFGWQ